MILFRTLRPIRHLLGSVCEASIQRRFYSADAADVLTKNGIATDIIRVAPKEFVKASFPSGATVDGGNKLAPTQTKDKPSISYNAQGSDYYLLYMTDPDSPSRGRPTFREWHLWLVGNIPGSDVSKGEVLSDYIAPCPPKQTGVHRIVFLVFHQSGKLSFDEPRLGNKRSNGREQFKIQKLADKYKLGDPVAGNFFFAEWDEYVDTIYENLAKL